MDDEDEVNTRGATKVDCPHCGKRIYLRKMTSGGYFTASTYLVAKDGEWVPAKEEDR
jgi:hypothetical protein